MLMKGILPIAKSNKFENIRNNFDSYFALEQEDVARINQLNKNWRLNTPEKCAWAGYLDLFD